MKKKLIILILVVLTTLVFGQNPIKSLTYHEDNLQVQSWPLGMDFKTAKDQNIIKDEYVWKTDCDVIINLVSKTVTYYYVPEKSVEHVFKLKNFKTTKTSYFFEFEVDGYYQNQKVLICENEDGTYSSITQHALSTNDTISGGDFDRNVTVSIK
jgi:hypothetical protein